MKRFINPLVFTMVYVGIDFIGELAILALVLLCGLCRDWCVGRGGRGFIAFRGSYLFYRCIGRIGSYFILAAVARCDIDEGSRISMRDPEHRWSHTFCLVFCTDRLVWVDFVCKPSARFAAQKQSTTDGFICSHEAIVGCDHDGSFIYPPLFLIPQKIGLCGFGMQTQCKDRSTAGHARFAIPHKKAKHHGWEFIGVTRPALGAMARYLPPIFLIPHTDWFMRFCMQIQCKDRSTDWACTVCDTNIQSNAKQTMKTDWFMKFLCCKFSVG